MFGSLKIAVNGLVCYSNILLNFVFWLGLGIAFFACLMSIFLIINVYFGSKIYPIGLSSIILSILFIGGVQLISLGIVGQYIARIYDETKNRPKYIIDEKINIYRIIKKILHKLLEIPFVFQLQQKICNNYDAVLNEFYEYLNTTNKSILEVGCSTANCI